LPSWSPEGRAEGGYSTTAHGDPNSSANAVLNVPLITGKLAVRGVFYSERRGGYIDNVPTAFTRNPNVDRGPSAYSSSYPAQLATYYNYNLVERAQNPTTYQGLRLAGLYQVNDDWNVLVQESYQLPGCRRHAGAAPGESRSHTAATAPGKLVHAGVEPGQVQQQPPGP